MSIETLMSFLLATAIIVVIPGPNIMLITHDSIRHGFKNSLSTVMGVSAGMILLFSLSLAGVTTLFVSFPWMFDLLKTMGVVYLIFLGITQIRYSLKSDKEDDITFSDKDTFFLNGFLISASNPKGLFFTVSFFPQFINSDFPVMPQVILLCGGCLMVASLIGAGYAFCAKKAQGLFRTPKFQSRVSLVSGIIMILFGILLCFARIQNLI